MRRRDVLAAGQPVRRAAKFELAVNVRTARALATTIPASLLARQRGDRMRRREVLARHGGARLARRRL